MTTNSSTPPTGTSEASATTDLPTDTASDTSVATGSTVPSGSANPTDPQDTTESAPPTLALALSDTDRTLMVFAQQIELAAAALYRGAVGGGANVEATEGSAPATTTAETTADTTAETTESVPVEETPDPVLTLLHLISANHVANANLMAAQLGRQSSNDPDTALVDQFSSAFGTTGEAAPADVLDPAYELESTLVATYQEMVGQLTSTDALTPIASIMMTEARQCAVLADAAGKGTDLAALLDNTATPLTLPAEG